MASSPFSKETLTLLFALSLLVHATFGTLICENLPQELCAFSISSKGKRCLLENYAGANGKVGYQCRTSDVDVGRMSNYIEKEDCVKACGADRKAVGISSDSLMEPQFTAKLCSPNCFQNCPNIIDLYFNLAAGEGVFLPDLCEIQRSNPHRAMAELLSSGVALGPASSDSSFSMVAAPPISI
ncbi:hypothetical protein MRB53_019123 [Persea americana]|uniref:Uncharacterized protein n=1 Tax=Persea americana TaxID=3435 RepID=A0ACC2M9P5_PERAE|nr:hypothetical protein MRB53_019123 [Persea americana]